MKIVKMHKGTREAFDDFLEQRLNDVEIDNDLADKYFAGMNLPVSVIPATKSFFTNFKNKIWLITLIVSVIIISAIFINTNTKNLQQNNFLQSKKTDTLNTTNFNNQSNLVKNNSNNFLEINNNTIKSADVNILNINKSIAKIKIATTTLTSNKNFILNTSIVKDRKENLEKAKVSTAIGYLNSNDKSSLIKKNTKQQVGKNVEEKNLVLESISINNKIVPLKFDNNINNILQKEIIKSNTNDKKVVVKSIDSLYIVW